MQDFTTILDKAVAVGNLTKQDKGWLFMQGLPIKYRRHVIEQIGAVVDKPNTLRFKRLKEAIELKIVAVEGAKQIDILLEEDALNIQLI